MEPDPLQECLDALEAAATELADALSESNRAHQELEEARKRQFAQEDRATAARDSFDEAVDALIELKLAR